MPTNGASVSKRTIGNRISKLPKTKRRRTQPANDDSVCEQCRKINLQKVLDPGRVVLSGIKSPKGILVANLGTRCHNAPTNNCQACILFHELRVPAHPQQSYELRAYSFLEYSTLINYCLCPEDLKSKDQPYLAVVSGRYAGDRLRQHTKEKGFLFCREGIAEKQQSLLIPQELKSEVNFSAIKEWWEYCRLNHKRLCSIEKTQIRNFKLIDCNTLSIDAAPSSCSYAALSYVWGKPPSESETSGSINGSKFSRTALDAICACKELGVSYLWVDQYCINQNDAAEKQEQISQMDIIYQQAEITIIAAAGSGATAGLPGVNGTRRRTPSAATIENIRIMSSSPHPHHTIPATTWGSRGWTMQEAILSRRRLVFTEDQVYFECRAMNCQESLKIHLDMIHSKRRDKTLKFVHSGVFGGSETTCFAPVDAQNTDHWSNMSHYLEYVQEYSTRNLTNDDDALRAFEGIIKYLEKSKFAILQIWGVPFMDPQNFPPDQYNSDSLIIGLLWGHKQQCWSPSGPHRRDEFPSWSWAGWKGGVRFYITNRDIYGVLRVLAKEILLEPETGQTINFLDFLRNQSRPNEIFSYPKALHLYLPVLLPNSITAVPGLEENGSWRLGDSVDGNLNISQCPRNSIPLEEMFKRKLLELLLIAEDTQRMYLFVIENLQDSARRVGIMTADCPRSWRNFMQLHVSERWVRLV